MLTADSIGKRYGTRWVLRAATLRAVPGQVRALVGRNGAGKSTLLRIAAGLRRADYGIVRCDDTTLLHPRLPALARRGLFMLPDHDLLSNALTVGAHLALAAGTFGREADEAMLDTLGLRDHLGKRPWQLSGGECRRAEVAVALMRRPRYLLADEPLRGIAPIDAELLLRVFSRMADGGCAVVVTGHELGTLLAAVDHVTWCTDGTTYELGPPATAVNDSRFQRHFLGPARTPA
ncbi:MAG TPA: ATP-binding cassette domain-containing protein [Gemmatimonadaceae bacterium]|nr:ATP-binding cassette domain-containing protein [Gemmatimonadaceae bacterium]